MPADRHRRCRLPAPRAGQRGECADRPRCRVPPRGARHRQALRRLHRQRPGDVAPAPRRDPRAARRERRRQVHARQDRLRRAPAHRRAAPVARRDGGGPEPGGSPAARDRHGVPALLFVRGAHRRREHRARAAREVRPRGARRAHRTGLGGVRTAARADRAGRGPVGRRAPAHRDRALPARSASASASRSCAACCRSRAC